jgi:hypothetical protein
MQTYHRLDDVQMSAIDRERAKAHMRSAELTIDIIFTAVEKTRLISAVVRRRLHAFLGPNLSQAGQ